MKPFNYHEPDTIEEACGLLKKHGDQARIIAGGTDLVIQMKRGVIAPGHVISIKRIETMRGITETTDGFRIGAVTPLAEVADHRGLKKQLPMISDSALSIGSAQVRNLATIAGNFCNAAPSADMAPGLLVLGTRLTIAGPDGNRELPLSDFFTGPGTTALETGEFVTHLFIPKQPESLRMTYLKHGPRQAMDCAVVGVAMCLDIDPSSGICRDVRIALGAVAPTPVRAVGTERMIAGKTVAELDFNAIESFVQSEASPITDVRGTAEYRSEMVSVLTRQAIETLKQSAAEA